MPSISDDQKQQAIALRSEGMAYLKIAAKVGCSERAAYKFLSGLNLSKPKPKPAPKPKQSNRKSRTDLLPPKKFPSSCPTHYTSINPVRHNALRNAPQPTKSEMYAMLALAVRNTARM